MRWSAALQKNSEPGTEDHDCAAYHGCARLCHACAGGGKVFKHRGGNPSRCWSAIWAAVRRKRLYLDTVTTGASNDIEQATGLARSMVTRFGMTQKVRFDWAGIP